MLLALVVTGWILVAAACAVWVGTAIRSAEVQERSGRVIPEVPPMPSRAEELGFVQISLFDVPAMGTGVHSLQREPVVVS